SPFFGICLSRSRRTSGCTRKGAKVSASTCTRRSQSPCQCASAPSPRQDTMPMPVIQVWCSASAMVERLHREFEDRRHLLHAGAELGIRKFDQAEGDLGVADALAVAADVGLSDREARAFV